MGKRRNEKKKFYTGGEGNTTSSYGGGMSNGNKFSVFNFDDTDLRVENDSRKSLAKFGAKSPNNKKSSAYRQPVDKYVFLEYFAQGNNIQQNRNDMSDADVIDTALEDITFRTDGKSSHGYLNSASKASFTKHLDFECSSCGAKSAGQGSRKPVGCRTDKKHQKVFYVDSDEDVRMESRSLISSFDLAKNEGSLEQFSKHGVNPDIFCELVVVDPNYVKYGAIYYTKCFLTFSKRFIRLEGSPLSDRKKTYLLEWSTSDILKIDYQQCESVKADVVKFHLKLEDKDLVETWEGNSGAVELEFVVLDDPQWSKKQEEIKSLDLKYKAAWNTIISECSFIEPFEELIYPEGDSDAVFISRSDVELLRPRTFINDTIVDFYVKYLVSKTKQEEHHKFHFFNTFFFRKLAGMDRDLRRALEGREAFERVRKWTRNVNLFEKDYIFIPVNFSLHWSLIVICHPGEVTKLGDKDIDDTSKWPCILHMDSIKGSHRGFENLIRSYLWEEWKERNNKHDADTVKAKFLNLEFSALQLPQQENLFDCGLFLLHYAELFLEQALKFSSITCCDFLNKDWFLPTEVSLKKRDHIRKLINKIVEDNALRDHTPNCTKSVQETNVKGSCLGIQFGFNDDCETMGQSNSVEILNTRNIDKSEIDETVQPCKQLPPINQFSNMKLPIEEEEDERQANFPRDTGNKPVIIYVQDEDCVHVVPSSSMSSEDVAACVVEDSEDEIGTECIRKTRKPFPLVSPMGLKIEQIDANKNQIWKEKRRLQRRR